MKDFQSLYDGIPTNTDWMKHQMNHEDTRTYGYEIFATAKRNPYRDALEIGCAWGVSALAILCAQDEGHLTSVDVNPKTRADNEIAINGLENRWTFVNKDSRDFWEADNGSKRYNLICIDGSHLYIDVVNDLFQAWERLKPNGTLIIDDYTHPKNNVGEGDKAEYGVSLACWELIQHFKIRKVNAMRKILVLKKDHGAS